ncbi:SSI family serine proteinase inhibitor [Thermomonospora amylolytica]|uniref:SSI family serine proteinase inhibitor n=1 Tax=Thermomonospora amylolytica TaxID=1411117 RepID=UPI000E6B4E71|nr:SSI family serine proteinase inhibitor [Thermomonospora amylolytica]
MRYRTPLTTAAGVATFAAIALTGCGAEDPAGAPPASVSPAPRTELTVEVRDRPGMPAVTWTLTCDPAGGTHPRPQAACQALAAADRPFEPVPEDAACTQIHGGDQTARVTGTWRGDRVDARFTRLNGCEIARWQKAAPLLTPSA